MVVVSDLAYIFECSYILEGGKSMPVEIRYRNRYINLQQNQIADNKEDVMSYPKIELKAIRTIYEGIVKRYRKQTRKAGKPTDQFYIPEDNEFYIATGSGAYCYWDSTARGILETIRDNDKRYMEHIRTSAFFLKMAIRDVVDSNLPKLWLCFDKVNGSDAHSRGVHYVWVFNSYDQACNMHAHAPDIVTYPVQARIIQ